MSISLLPFITSVLSPATLAQAETDDGERALDELTRNERIVRLLDHSAGYMWQRDLVGELGLTASTGSRTLAQMEENGLVVRYRIGRRKVVCLPDREPDVLQAGSRSSHDNP